MTRAGRTLSMSDLAAIYSATFDDYTPTTTTMDDLQSVASESSGYVSNNYSTTTWHLYSATRVSADLFEMVLADEVPLSESEMGLVVEEPVGGYTFRHGKTELSRYCQVTRQPKPQCVITSEGVEEEDKIYIGQAAVKVTQNDETVFVRGRGRGRTRNNAEKACALSIVRCLYHMGQVRHR
jgi:hypothetical protein